MKTITQEAYEQLISTATPLLVDEQGQPLVLKLPGDIIVKKLEWQKKLRAKIYPRSKRFKRNSERLLKMGFTAPEVVDLFDSPEMQCAVILYKMVAGEELIQKLIRSNLQEKKTILKKVAEYYAQLNNNGVYCSPCHFRNIMIDEDLNLGLIDVQNNDFRLWRLGLDARARNFRRVFKYEEHAAQVIESGAQQFFNHYMVYCQFSAKQSEKFIQLLRKNVPIFFKGKNFVS